MRMKAETNTYLDVKTANVRYLHPNKVANRLTGGKMTRFSF